MKRTQIYLTTEQWRDLVNISAREHKPVAELIREAVDNVYRVKTDQDFKRALHDAAGIWKDRADLEPTDRYVRRLRRGTRLKRLGFGK